MRSVMREGERADRGDAVSLARACFEQIASVLQDSISKAEQMGALDMIERLNAAKAAADRGSELTGKLAAMLQFEQLDADSPRRP